MNQGSNTTSGRIRILFLSLTLLVIGACHKPLDLERHPVPGNSLILEFAKPIRYVIDLKVDGLAVPVEYSGGKRRLLIQGLSAGKHNFDVHSVSYVFGPEFESFEVSAEKGAYFFIHTRKYRAAIPSDRAKVSIRAYRKKLKVEGGQEANSKGVSAHFE